MVKKERGASDTLQQALKQDTEAVVQQLRDQYRAPGTEDTYSSGIKAYLEMCKAKKMEPWPLSLQQLEIFAAFLKSAGYRGATYIFAVKAYHKDNFPQSLGSESEEKRMTKKIVSALAASS